jgi:hypothetical protein
MTEIIPIWLEKVRHGWKTTADRRGKWLKLFPYGWKKSDMVGKLLRIEEGKDWNYSHMVGKSPTWSENYSGWKATNSDMVGNFPQGVRKGVPSHRTFSLSHPSYRREFPIPFSISVFSYDYSLWKVTPGLIFTIVYEMHLFLLFSWTNCWIS